MTFSFFAKATASGMPTYPKPMTDRLSSPLSSFSYNIQPSSPLQADLLLLEKHECYYSIQRFDKQCFDGQNKRRTMAESLDFTGFLPIFDRKRLRCFDGNVCIVQNASKPPHHCGGFCAYSSISLLYFSSSA